MNDGLRLYATLVLCSLATGHIASLAEDAAGSVSEAHARHDAQILSVVGKVTSGLRLGKTTLMEVADEFAVAKTPKLSWEEAVDYADRKLSGSHEKRVAFLLRYLKRGAPFARSPALKLHELPVLFTPDEPKYIVALYPKRSMEPGASGWGVCIVRDSDQASANILSHRISLYSREIGGRRFSHVSFDSQQTLRSYHLQTEPDTDGYYVVVGAGTGEAGPGLVYGNLHRKKFKRGGPLLRGLDFGQDMKLERKRIYDPDLELVKVWEIYREGKLCERQHFGLVERQDGKLQLMNIRTEKFSNRVIDGNHNQPSALNGG